MNYLSKIEELEMSYDEDEIVELYHEIEEKWFNIKRFNDESAVLHRDTMVMNIFYDRICELVVKSGAKVF